MKASENGQVTRGYTFGPFLVDTARRMLLREGETVPLTPKAFEILLVLIESSGQVLEKEELLTRIWPDTVVEENNLARNISALRKALGENPNEHQYIVTVPGRGYRFVASVQALAESAQLTGQARKASSNEPEDRGEEMKLATDALAGMEMASSAELPHRQVNRRRRRLALALPVIALSVIAGLVFLMRSSFQNNQTRAQRPLTRLTFDPGLQGEPSWSPDGSLIAYTSDRDGNADIWVRQVGGGNPIQVTHSPDNDWQPNWSPDGSKLVFRSERNGGGLYVVPALGGSETKIAGFGYHPRWSPDGSQLLFYGSAMESADDALKIYLLKLNGSQPREILTQALGQFTNLRSVVWHPDGQRISFLGHHRQMGSGFWIVPLSGGVPTRMEIPPPVQQQLSEFPIGGSANFVWAPSGRSLYLEGISNGVRNIWKVGVDPQTLNLAGSVERLTTGPGLDTDLAISTDGKKLAFTTRNERTRLWSWPFNTGQLQGDGTAIIPAEVDAALPDLSRDGQKLAFILNRSGRLELWEKSLANGHEALLAGPDDYRRVAPCWSRDGSRVAYRRSRFTNSHLGQNEFSIFLLPAGGGVDEQRLTSPSAFAETPSDWSADGQWLLGSSDRPTPGRKAICLFPVSAAPKAETQMRVLASHADFNLRQPRFSPDGRWFSFSAVKATETGVSTLYVIPASGGDWIRVTEGQAWDDKGAWAPDGKTIYFLSNRGGLFNVWGIRFDPSQGRVIGEPFRVTAFDHPGRIISTQAARMISSQISPLAFSLAAERLILPITEVTGAVWILENMDR